MHRYPDLTRDIRNMSVSARIIHLKVWLWLEQKVLVCFIIFFRGMSGRADVVVNILDKLTSITPFVDDEQASEIVSLARAKLHRGTSNNLCTAPY